MSVLVVGVSHRSAPVSLLERLARDTDGVVKLVTDALDVAHVREATVISTCNRLEVYAEVDRFHGSVEELSRLLVSPVDDDPMTLVPHLYVHYDHGAVAHLFHVASGLDSMVVGESQVLGQAREALRLGQEHGAVGPALNTLFQQALRVAKRTHAETDIDRAALSLVSAALERAPGGVAGLDAVVVGAGAMASLAVSTLHRLGAGSISVVNRTAVRADRLASQYDARVLPLSELSRAAGAADVVISCTGAPGVVITRDLLEMARQGGHGPLTILDLALPHDVDPTVAGLPGVTLIGLATLAEELADAEGAADIAEVRAIVSQEIAAYLSVRRQDRVTPTVVALRSMATTVVDAELERLADRLPDLDDATRAEVVRTVRRVADKLLHQPTVRVKELAATEEGAVSYAAALAELFALDPEAVEAVTSAAVPDDVRGEQS